MNYLFKLWILLTISLRTQNIHKTLENYFTLKYIALQSTMNVYNTAINATRRLATNRSCMPRTNFKVLKC